MLGQSGLDPGPVKIGHALHGLERLGQFVFGTALLGLQKSHDRGHRLRIRPSSGAEPRQVAHADQRVGFDGAENAKSCREARYEERLGPVVQAPLEVKDPQHVHALECVRVLGAEHPATFLQALDEQALGLLVVPGVAI